MGDKIEPCPWCGEDKAKELGPTGGGWHWVGCTHYECLAHGAQARTPEAAIAAWNEVAGLRGKLKHAETHRDRAWIAMEQALDYVQDCEDVPSSVRYRALMISHGEEGYATERDRLRAEVERLKAEAEERNDRDWSRST